MTHQIDSPDGKPRKDERPSPDTRGVSDGATGTTAVAGRQPGGAGAQAARSGVQGGTEAFEQAPEGQRSHESTSNLEQARAVGQAPAREGSRQGKDAAKSS